MEKVPRELFECPVCLEIPTTGEIYQCKNGHIVCESCSKKKNIVLCPQCRVAFEPNKLRNRAMESFVSGMEVGCKFEKQGCGVRMSRKDLEAHLENTCEFKFPTFNLCKVLGFNKCDFVSRRSDDIYRHFVEHHSPEFGSRVRISGTLGRSLEYMKTSKENRMTFTPLSVTIKSTSLKVLLLFYTNVKQNDYSVICLHFGDHDDEEVRVCDVKIDIHAPKKKFGLVWSGQPSHYTKVEELMANPPFKMSIPYILKQLGDDDNKGLDYDVVFS